MPTNIDALESFDTITEERLAEETYSDVFGEA